ncbi:MAG: hypothetical protein EXR92_01060 [Gemmatimonadetes bacterium]|nr:hypothetical protein [Gemmatimonadota bacterium]
MVMELDFGLLADAATVDASGKLNVLGIFDRIQAREFPACHGRIALVLRFSASFGEAGSHQVEIRLRGPNGHEILRLDGRMDLGPGVHAAAEGIKVPHVLNLDGITFPEPGSYSFDIYSDGVSVMSIPLRLESVAGIGAGEPRTMHPALPSAFVPGRGGSAQA